MDFKKSILLILQKAIVWMSFRRLFLLFITALVVIMSITVFEERRALNEVISERDISTAPLELAFELSAGQQAKIVSVVDVSPRIMGVSVQTVNLKVNERRVIFAYSDTPALTQVWEQSRQKRGTVSMMFDTDEMNNLQMVAVVNGEFICLKMSETQLFHTTPEMAKHVQSICRLSIPPFYGNFNGFITFYLDRPLAPEIEHEVRIEAVRMSNDIYRELLAGKRMVPK